MVDSQPPATYVAKWHEFTENWTDPSMCVCGVPALNHDQVYPPGATQGGEGR